MIISDIYRCERKYQFVCVTVTAKEIRDTTFQVKKWMAEGADRTATCANLLFPWEIHKCAVGAYFHWVFSP